MTHHDKQVFISYAWGGESERIANELDADLQSSGIKIIRDKRDLGFKGMIRDFMQQIGRGYAVIVVISDKYLKSPNCMYELVEIARNKDIYDRIFPIVLADADIYNPIGHIRYIKHWEDKIKELNEAIKTLNPAHLQGVYAELNSYDDIRDNISNLTFLLKDMNTLTPEMHESSNFATMIAALKKRLSDTVTEITAPKEQAPTAAPKPSTTKKPRTTKVSKPKTASSTRAYMDKVIRQLVRDNYKELPAESFGDLEFARVLEKNTKYLFNTLDEFHRFVIVEEPELSEDRYIEIEKDIKLYAKGLGDQRSSYVHVICLVLTDRVSGPLKKLIYDTKPAKYAFAEMGSSVMVVYASQDDDIIHPKVIGENYDSMYGEKIQAFLKP
jgi:hypothetical protein